MNTSCSPEKDPAGPFSLFQAILAGDFILSAASMALARIGNITVVKVLSQVIEDLVRGTVTTTVGGGDRWSLCFQPSVLCSQGSSCSWDPRRTRTSGSNTTWRKPSRRRRASSPTVAKQYVRSFSRHLDPLEEEGPQSCLC